MIITVISIEITILLLAILLMLGARLESIEKLLKMICEEMRKMKNDISN